MRSCVILGSGRSGTSTAAGVLSSCGYFMGENLYPPDEGNPKGYFESLDVNGVNEEILAQVVPPRPRGMIGDIFFRNRLPEYLRWLARVPLETRFSCSPLLRAKLSALSSKRPFCYKDPRFSYTLPVWKPLLEEVVYVCVFRDPGTTVASLLKEARREISLRRVKLSFGTQDAVELWRLMYEHIVSHYRSTGGDWIFLHYEQLLDGSSYEKIERELGVRVDRDFVDPRLNRSSPVEVLSLEISALYEELCDLAAYRAPESP